MAKTRIGTNAQFTSVGKSLSVVGDRMYAYSGPVQSTTVSSADFECLNFTTGKGYALVRFDYGTDYGGNNDVYVLIQLNGLTVWKTNNTALGTISDQPIKMVLPPYTHLVFKWGISGVTKNMTVMMTGRIYDA